MGKCGHLVTILSIILICKSERERLAALCKSNTFIVREKIKKEEANHANRMADFT